MDNPDSNTTTAKTSAPDDVIARLDRIEKTVQEIKEHDPNIPKPDANKDKTGNRLLLAGAFALVGWKLVGLIGLKVGFWLDVARAGMRGGWEEVKSFAVMFFTFGNKEEKPFEKLKGSIYLTAVGSIVGVIGGLWLGLIRGDRLDKASDLFSHPIESLKKIFGPDPKKKKEAEQNASAQASDPTKQEIRFNEHVVSKITHEGKLVGNEQQATRA